ncbi:MAG: crossover junction endodeoxyribonuclease RuvC, partial [Pseudomonadota bacterium]
MSRSATRILGIDPGSRLTGFGVIDFEGDRARFVDAGVIKTGNGELSERLEVIFDATRELISRHQPDTLAVEQVFVSRNAGSALKLGAARSAHKHLLYGQGVGLVSTDELACGVEDHLETLAELAVARLNDSRVDESSAVAFEVDHPKAR